MVNQPRPRTANGHKLWRPALQEPRRHAHVPAERELLHPGG